MMEIDEFLNRIENGEKIEPEKQKSPIDEIIERLNDPDADKVSVSDRVISELKSYEEKIKGEKISSESLIMKIKQILLEIRNNIAANNLLIAKSSFSEINDLYEMVPADLAEQKIDLKKDISAMESLLLSKLSEFYRKDLDRKRRIILMSLAQGKKYVMEKNVQGAITEYRRCQEIYHSLPEGFLEDKIELYEKIVEMYKEVIIAAQITNLQNKLDI